MSIIAHPHSEVHPSARLGDGVRVEAGAVVEADCIIGEGCVIGRHSIIWRGTVLGKNNRIFPFCSLGGEPQDKKYAGEEAPLIIGDRNTIREYCFINKGTAANGETRIGDENWIMAYVHIAHDCVMGNHVTIANTAQFAGHVAVGDYAVIGGGALFHQFIRIGNGAMVHGGEAVVCDVSPYAMIGRGVVSVNSEGMRRAGHNPQTIAQMRRAYKILYREGLAIKDAAAAIGALSESQQAPLNELIEFLQLPQLKLLRPKAAGAGE